MTIYHNDFQNRDFRLRFYTDNQQYNYYYYVSIMDDKYASPLIKVFFTHSNMNLEL